MIPHSRFAALALLCAVFLKADAASAQLSGPGPVLESGCVLAPGDKHGRVSLSTAGAPEAVGPSASEVEDTPPPCLTGLDPFGTVSAAEAPLRIGNFGCKSPGRLIDLSDQKTRQIVVDREPGQYLGHPTTVLLEDGRTMLAVYPKGHGRGAIVMKRSTDGGLTWSARLPVPDNWNTSLETPTIHRTVDASGTKRLILFSGLYPARIAVSEDDGMTWSPLRALGAWGGIVVMSSVERLSDGRYLAMFHDDGRFFRAGGRQSASMTLYKTFSHDGGQAWSAPEAVLAADTVHLCEPGLLRSPDGRQLAALLRENTRTHNSFVIFSDDEGESWTAPQELPSALTGDRHTARYSPDGRLLISFRDMAAASPTYGDWVAWVGTYEDIAAGRDGQYRIRLMDNLKGSDCGYPGVEVLPDGTFVLTTYGHWTAGEEPYIVSVRLRLSELDE